MPPPAGVGYDFAVQAVRARPNEASRTIARYLYGQYPEYWSSLEACRSMIRKIRGNNGKRLRKHAVPDLARPNQQAGLIPEGIKHFPNTDNWRPRTGKALIIADMHPPFHDRGAVETALEFSYKEGCDICIVNGDGTDFPGISRFVRDLRRFEGTFREEVRLVRAFWHGVINTATHLDEWHWRMGNHDDRFELYLMTKAPEVFPVLYEEGVNFANILKADELGIQIIPEGRDLYLGHLYVTHGHLEGMTSGGYPAKKLWTKTHVTAICGHIHKAGTYTQPDYKGTEHQTWTMGCLCQKNWDYARKAGYQWGFAICEYDQDTNDFSLQNFKIMDDYRVRPA